MVWKFIMNMVFMEIHSEYDFFSLFTGNVYIVLWYFTLLISVCCNIEKEYFQHMGG